MTSATSFFTPSVDAAAAYGLDGFPFAWVVAFLFGVVLLRAQGTYWLGRAIAAGVWRTRLSERLEGPAMARAFAFVHRWGPLAVTFSFFTVGLQTMINAAAGLVKMPWPRYTIAMVPGCVAWAFIYATIGLGAFLAIAAAAAGSPWGVTVVVLLVAALVVALALRARRRRRGTGDAANASAAHVESTTTSR